MVQNASCTHGLKNVKELGTTPSLSPEIGGDSSRKRGEIISETPGSIPGFKKVGMPTCRLVIIFLIIQFKYNWFNPVSTENNKLYLHVQWQECFKRWRKFIESIKVKKKCRSDGPIERKSSNIYIDNKSLFSCIPIWNYSYCSLITFYYDAIWTPDTNVL